MSLRKKGGNLVSVATNKAAVRRLNDEVYVKGNLEIADKHFAPTYVMHTPGTEYKGAEGFKQSVKNNKIACPDYYSKIDKMIAEGDMVATFYTIGGTFTHEFGGVKPTGKKLKITSIVLSRFENGKAVEGWVYVDRLDWFRQLGVPIPPE
jgi:predicted ester cyclase